MSTSSKLLTTFGCQWAIHTIHDASINLLLLLLLFFFLNASLNSPQHPFTLTSGSVCMNYWVENKNRQVKNFGRDEKMIWKWIHRLALYIITQAHTTRVCCFIFESLCFQVCLQDCWVLNCLFIPEQGQLPQPPTQPGSCWDKEEGRNVKTIMLWSEASNR